MIIKRINVVKLAVVQACMGVAFGVIAAILFMLVGSSMMSHVGGAEAAGFGLIGGIAMLVILPLMYGIGGFIFGAIAAALYNLVAGMVGGIELDVD